MKKQSETGISTKNLRAVAEEKLAKTKGGVPESHEISRENLIHELQVHQTELEMQNEELKRGQLALEESRDRYLDLYDFAPVGYFTITHNGRISEVNLTGAKLLGGDRGILLDRGFGHFVVPEDLFLWEQHLMSVLKSDGKQECELTLRLEDQSMFYARLESMRLVDSGGMSLIRMAVSDITELKKIEELKKGEESLRLSLDEERRFNDVLLQREFRIKELKDDNERIEEMVGKAKG